MNDPSEPARGVRELRRQIATAAVAVLIPIVPIVAGLAITSGSARTQTASAADTQFKAVGQATGSTSLGQSASGSGTQGGQGAGQTGGAGSRSGSSGSGSSSGSAGSGSGSSGSAGSGSGSSGSAGSGSGASGSSGSGSGTSGSQSGASSRSGQSPADQGALVALLLHHTTMRFAPAGRALANVGLRTNFGSPTTFLVVRQASGWLGVISTESGNGRIGWIPRSSVSLRRVRWQLTVSLSAKRLAIVENGKTLRTYTVAVGRPSAPTPTGHFAVTDRLATHDPSGPYGCCILALSAHSPHAIQGWSGGNRIAIHSTPDSSSIGEAVSHGCVRVTLAEGTWLLSHIPLGTPTVIRS